MGCRNFRAECRRYFFNGNYRTAECELIVREDGRVSGLVICSDDHTETRGVVTGVMEKNNLVFWEHGIMPGRFSLKVEEDAETRRSYEGSWCSAAEEKEYQDALVPEVREAVNALSHEERMSALERISLDESRRMNSVNGIPEEKRDYARVYLEMIR